MNTEVVFVICLFSHGIFTSLLYLLAKFREGEIDLGDIGIVFVNILCLGFVVLTYYNYLILWKRKDKK
jgi:hypothetical protein